MTYFTITPEVFTHHERVSTSKVFMSNKVHSRKSRTIFIIEPIEDFDNSGCGFYQDGLEGYICLYPPTKLHFEEMCKDIDKTYSNIKHLISKDLTIEGNSLTILYVAKLIIANRLIT